MAYKEMKLNPGEAKDLNALWNAGMNPQKSGGKKPADKKKGTTGKNPADKKKGTTGKNPAGKCEK